MVHAVDESWVSLYVTYNTRDAAGFGVVNQDLAEEVSGAVHGWPEVEARPDQPTSRVICSSAQLDIHGPHHR